MFHAYGIWTVFHSAQGRVRLPQPCPRRADPHRGSGSGSLLWAELLGQQLQAIYEAAAPCSLVPPSSAALAHPRLYFMPIKI